MDVSGWYCLIQYQYMFNKQVFLKPHHSLFGYCLQITDRAKVLLLYLILSNSHLQEEKCCALRDFPCARSCCCVRKHIHSSSTSQISYWLLALHMHHFVKSIAACTSVLPLSLFWPPIPSHQCCYAAHTLTCTRARVHVRTHTHTHLLGSDYKAFAMVREMPLRKAVWEIGLLAASPNLFTPLYGL